MPVDVAGGLVPFISPEDLVVTKLLAGREKDIDDVRGVLAERGATLNMSRVGRRWVCSRAPWVKATSHQYWSASWIAGGGPSRSGRALRAACLTSWYGGVVGMTLVKLTMSHPALRFSST